ncbi:hypothetical protein MLD38_024726 [Melastoma candidum]|uniref:Uncharacterized protein n=1 Tax=Melastoma candidum TaxID=119954 RepID=A0ACB9NY95_9MYRT|nr:hypothetical protein MLD38_024726 [Melastoma candidum]
MMPEDSAGEYADHHQKPNRKEDEEETFLLTSSDDDDDDEILCLHVDAPPSGPQPFSFRRLLHFTGPGFLMSIAFLDPGNLEGDLQAGARAGYTLLWLLMWTTGMGWVIQMLSARVGVVTGKNLAEICRDEYPSWARLVLWVMAEVTLVAADIQEVIGSAVGVWVLSNGKIPVWVGVIITASDCFMFLFLENYGVRKLEAVFAVLISTMAVSFACMFGETKPSRKKLLTGLLIPRLSSKTIRQAVGVVGCVITPHNVFLHSALVQSREIDHQNKSQVQEALTYFSIESSAALSIMFVINLLVTSVFANGFYGTEEAKTIGLRNARHYLQEKHGGGLFPILYIWGIGLLAAGQSSTITGTYAGQFIMGGFLNLRLKRWLRATISRSLAIVPTMIVAVAFNASEASLDILNEWLNVLQCIQIPFALIPLLTMVSQDHLMGSFKVGPILGKVSWMVATILILINGYLLTDIIMSEVSGFLYIVLVLTAVAAYLSFIAYLLAFGGVLPRNWLGWKFDPIEVKA